MTPFYSIGSRDFWIDLASASGGNVDLGKILQVVSSFKNDTASVTGTTATDTGLSCTITPSDTANKIFITTTLNIGPDVNDTAYLFCDRNGSTIGAGTGGTTDVASAYYPNAYGSSGFVNLHSGVMSWSYLDSPSSTSALTYKITFSGQSATETIYLNRRANNTVFVGSSSLTVFEVDGT